MVCPEGKEKSCCADMSSDISFPNSCSWKSYGRIRATRGFRVMLHTTSPRTRAMPIEKPVLRYFAKNRSKTATPIQNTPPSPNRVTMGMVLSRKVHCRCSWIQSRMGRSKDTATEFSRVCSAVNIASPLFILGRRLSAAAPLFLIPLPRWILPSQLLPERLRKRPQTEDTGSWAPEWCRRGL